MSHLLFHVEIERRDPSRNMARFYRLSLQPTLFGPVCLTRAWGRIGQQGRERQDWFATETEAIAGFAILLRRKRRRGYRPVSR